MGQEIERKFLLRNAGWRPLVSRSVTMRQAYLSEAGRASVRVRVEGEQANLNIKSSTLSIERQEFEFPIPLSEALGLFPLCADHPVEKVRHYVPDGEFTWEIDEFEGANAGLIVAEIELASPDQVHPTPDWLGEEVSLDKRYYNVYLAKHPYGNWGDSPPDVTS
ncbi:MAG: CYTH domain-containing protein [Pseudomonadota bacterium]